MTLYQYQCQKCAHTFKRIFLILQDTPFACPECGDMTAKKVLNYATRVPENGIDQTDPTAEYVPWKGLAAAASVAKMKAFSSGGLTLET